MTGDDDCGHHPGAPARLHGTAFWQLGRVARIAQRRTEEMLVGAGMRRYFYGVLASLDEFGPSSQADLGRRLGVDPSDVVAIVNTLVERDFVRRERDPDDRRRNSVAITPAGRSTLDGFDSAIADAEDQVLAGLSGDERAQLVALLRRIG